MGRVAAGLADMLFPEVIVLGSLARYLGPEFEQVIHDTFEVEAHPHALERCRLCRSVLAERLQDCSALAAALNVTNS